MWLSSHLKIGITFAILSSEGKIPFVNERLITWASKGLNSNLHNLSSFVERSWDPGLFFGFSFEIILSISSKFTFLNLNLKVIFRCQTRRPSTQSKLATLLRKSKILFTQHTEDLERCLVKISLVDTMVTMVTMNVNWTGPQHRDRKPKRSQSPIITTV